jgi:hypothetical protein
MLHSPPPSSPKCRNDVTGRFLWPFIHRHRWELKKKHVQIFMTRQFLTTYFTSRRLSSTRIVNLIHKNDPIGFYLFLVPKNSSRIVSLALNDNSLAQGGPRKLKLMSLEPHGYKNSRYVFKKFLQCLWMKQHCKTFRFFIKGQCDKIGIWWQPSCWWVQREEGTYETQPMGNW